LLSVALLWGCFGGAVPQLPDPEPLEIRTPAWPQPGAPLAVFAPPERLARPVVVALDPGHGTAGNRGNQGVLCQFEEQVTLDISRHLAARLGQVEGLTVVLLREDAEGPSYPERVAAAKAAGADVYVSIHTDVRLVEEPEQVQLADGRVCNLKAGDRGVSVLYSDEGPLTEARLGLARDVMAEAVKAGFEAYRGEGYEDLYEEDPQQPGVFVDRHAPNQRILVLRRPAMPSILVETHHALDPDEARRWQETRTHDALAQALVTALSRFAEQRDAAEGSGE